jgi:hypothetical protein
MKEDRDTFIKLRMLLYSELEYMYYRTPFQLTRYARYGNVKPKSREKRQEAIISRCLEELNHRFLA